MVKRATLLFNSLCRNVAKQVARFCCPIYRRKKGGDEKKAKGLLFGFIMAALEIILGRKNCLTEIKRGLFGGNLLKNPARYMCLGKKGVHWH